jgi:hypothetical protein
MSKEAGMDKATEFSGVEGLIEEGEAFRRMSAKAAPAPAGVRRARKFYIGISIAFLVVTFAGFSRTYFLKSFTDTPALGGLLHVHGAVFTAWLLLLFTQSTLVATHRIDWHRRLGIFGALLALTMVPLGLAVAITAVRHGIAKPVGDPLAFLIFPLGQTLLFGGFVSAALWQRRTPEVHRRLMVVATASLMTPAIVRLPFVEKPVLALMLSTLFIVAGMIHDWRTRGSVHRVYVIGALILALSGPLRFAVSRTDAWHSVARYLVE